MRLWINLEGSEYLKIHYDWVKNTLNVSQQMIIEWNYPFTLKYKNVNK